MHDMDHGEENETNEQNKTVKFIRRYIRVGIVHNDQY